MLASRRTWTYVAGASVVGALTLALFFSAFAQARTGSTRKAALRRTCAGSRLKGRTLAEPVRPATARPHADHVADARARARRRRVAAAYRPHGVPLARSPTCSRRRCLLFLFFGDAWLLRAHLPSVVLLLVFAACGVAWVADRLGHAAGVAVGCTRARADRHDDVVEPVRPPPRPGVRPEALRPDEPARPPPRRRGAVRPAAARDATRTNSSACGPTRPASSSLLDRGIPRWRGLHGRPRPIATWPRWVVGVPPARGFERSRFFEAEGGPYRLRAKDTVGRHALYER